MASAFPLVDDLNFKVDGC